MYVPKSEEHKHRLIMEVAQARNENPNDVHIKLLTFGHLFKNDVARTAAMAYVRSGKACLSAEGIKSLVFKSGKMLYIRYIEQSAERCIIEVKRADFPSDIPPQRFEYTWEDAVRAGNSTQLNYKKMPAAMLTARCWMKMARDYFSDVVAGYYSVDELMDNENMNDHERAMISAQSMGEDINLSTRPQPQRHTSRRPQAQPAPQPQPAPKHIEIDQSINSLPEKQSMSVSQTPSFQTQAEWDDYIARNPLPSPPMPTGRKRRPDDPVVYAPTPMNGFDNFQKVESTYKNIGLDIHDAVNSMAQRGLEAQELSTEDHKAFFYRWAFSQVIRENEALEDQWWQRRTAYSHVFNAIQVEFKLLASVDHSDIVRALVEVNAAFFELCRVAAYIKEGGALWLHAQNVLKNIINKKQGMSAVIDIYNKAMGY